MSKTIRPHPYDPEPAVDRAAPRRCSGCPKITCAYFISDKVVDQLDLWEITARYEQERRGGPALQSPDEWLKVHALRLLRWGAVFTTLPPRLHEDIAFRVLAANTPDFSHRSDFVQGPPDSAVTQQGLFLQARMTAMVQRRLRTIAGDCWGMWRWSRRAIGLANAVEQHKADFEL